ncbi:MAG: 4Fe-4S binding protein [Proteobacteria bacterium]|nr:4Fe-4S binding protein [Pseudomonadota bacterium]
METIVENHERKNRIRTIRHWIQLVVLLATLSVGLQFYLYVQQAVGTGSVTISRPSSVEGFLPIGALMAWKRFLITAEWDGVHPAAMVIFGFAVLISFAFRKSFCSWFCPVGTLSEWFHKLGRGLFGRNFFMPIWLDYPLRSVKYLLLGFFVWVIGSMPVAAISDFLRSPYYTLSDVKMLHFFTRMTVTTGLVLTVLLIGSLFFANFWCRYFCPYGALMGLLGALGPTKIQRNPESCTGCGRCSKMCPNRLDTAGKIKINSPECTGCLDCTIVCPVEETLVFRTGASSMAKRWSPKSLGIVVVVLYCTVVCLAALTGRWKSSVSEDEFRARLRLIDSPSMVHPSVESGNRPPE